MPSVTIHDMSDNTYAALTARAARDAQLLEEYVRDELVRLAQTANMDEAMQRVRARMERASTRLSPEQILGWLDADRR